MARLAKTWSDHYFATMTAESLRRETGDESIRVVPAWTRLLPAGAEKRLLAAIFGDGNDDEEKANDAPKGKHGERRSYKDAWVIFAIDENDEFKFFECMQHMEDIPSFIRRHLKDEHGIEYAVVTTNDVGMATLYATEDEANATIARAKKLSGTEMNLHTTTRKMFDDDESIDALRMIFSDNTTIEPEYCGDGTRAEDEDWDGDEEL